MIRFQKYGAYIVCMVLAACSTDRGAVTEPAEPSLAKAAGTGGKTAFSYTLSGDASTAPSSNVPVASMSSTKPFFNLSVAGVSLVLSAPTGDVSLCRTGSGTYAADFGANAGTVWTGTLSIPSTGTMSFLGTDAGGATVQFSVSDATGGPVQSNGPTAGSFNYEYTSARFYFGSNSTHYDGLYRCVNITVTATP